MATSAGKVIFLLRAASAIALSKQADQPAANSCSGLVPMRAEPGVESLMSRRPSELREAPFSRPPVVWVLAVYATFPIWGAVRSFSRWVMVRSLFPSCCSLRHRRPGPDTATAVDLAKLLAAQGRSENARAFLQPVLEQFAEGSDTADLKAAQRL